MIKVPIDPRIPVGMQRIPVHDLPKGWRSRLAIWFNGLRKWAEKWAAHHTMTVLIAETPEFTETIVEDHAVSGRFRVNPRPIMFQPTVNDAPLSQDERSLQRLARLTAEPRSKRYSKSRRVLSMFEVGDETDQERRPANHQ